jgi:hypothetical protein
MKILVFDPGESTGWVFQDTVDGLIFGGTAGKDHRQIGELIHHYKPDVIVYETFKLYPGLAKSMSWNTFYPCEVIGVIRYLALLLNIPIVNQDASLKKYANVTEKDYSHIDTREWTVHTRDAFTHLKYYKMVKKIK